MHFPKLAIAVLMALATTACVGSALPPGTMVSGPPPVYYAPPPPPLRCYDRPGFYGPERVCRPAY